MKYGVLFILYGGGQVFFKGDNKNVSLDHIRQYIEGAKKIDEESIAGKRYEAYLYADDEEGNHQAMVRCSQVCGYMLIEDKNESGDEWKR